MFAITVKSILIASAVSLAAGTAGGLYVGVKWESGKHARQEIKDLATIINTAAEDVKKLTEQTKKEAVLRSQLQAAIIPQKETVIRETLQPVYTTCFITDDSLRALNSQAAAINSAIKGIGAVSSSNVTRGQNNGNAAASLPAASGAIR